MEESYGYVGKIWLCRQVNVMYRVYGYTSRYYYRVRYGCVS